MLRIGFLDETRDGPLYIRTLIVVDYVTGEAGAYQMTLYSAELVWPYGHNSPEGTRSLYFTLK